MSDAPRERDEPPLPEPGPPGLEAPIPGPPDPGPPAWEDPPGWRPDEPPPPWEQVAPPAERPPELAWSCPWGTIVLVLSLLLLYLGLSDWGRGDQSLVPTRRVLDAGGLVPGAHAAPHREGWRLIRATFVHAQPPVLLIGMFLVVFAGGAVERAAGRGALMCLFVVGGAGANAVRAAVETGTSLHTLAGAWPAGALLGGAAIGLALRAGRPALSLLMALAVDVALLLLVASAQQLALGPLELVLGVSSGVGVLLGLLLRPQRPGEPPLQGCLLALVALLTLGLGEAGLMTAPRTRGTPAPWTPPPAPPELVEGLSARPLQTLGVEVALPRGWNAWDEGRKRAECPECGAELGASAGEGKRPCPQCKREVRPRPPSHVLFVEPAPGAPRRVQVWTRPRGAFDAPDTLAGNVLAGLGRADGPLRDPRLREDRPFQGQLGLGHLLALEASLDGQRDMLYRMYLFVGPKRTVRVDALAPRRRDLQEEAADVALFDEIARGLKELP